jgi:hypothetical protein
MFEEHPIEEHPIDSVEIFKIPEVRKICEELIKCCGTSREKRRLSQDQGSTIVPGES